MVDTIGLRPLTDEEEEELADRLCLHWYERTSYRLCFWGGCVWGGLWGAITVLVLR
jgi:hypothetical protein